MAEKESTGYSTPSEQTTSVCGVSIKKTRGFSKASLSNNTLRMGLVCQSGMIHSVQALANVGLNYTMKYFAQ